MDKINKEELMSKFGIEDEELLEKVAGGAKECRDSAGLSNCLFQCLTEHGGDHEGFTICCDTCSLLHCGYI